jgi:cellulose synthase/poly-beta-1,6-N-acetylglucosamine synthase-like glycosyltransferase
VYNESAYTIKKTLYSLNQQFQNGSLDVLIVCDGEEQMSTSVKDWIPQLFPGARAIKDWPVDAETHIVTVIRSSEFISNLGSVSLLIKRQNRKKPNSHEWFFGAFVMNGPRYCFTTDCGTFFSPGCVPGMMKYMDDNPGCVGATARMRQQTETQEVDLDNYSSIMSSESGGVGVGLLRMLQQSWSEHLHLGEMNLADLFGVLPVLHGPCCMLRCEAIANGAVDRYFEMLYSPPEEGGLIQGSLNLAEDRIYSIVATFQVGDRVQKRFTHLCVDQTFYFDNELSLEKLALQRRRWWNGNQAAMIYYVSNIHSLVFSSSNTTMMKISAFCVSWYILISMFLAYFAPMFFGLLYVDAIKAWLVRYDVDPTVRESVGYTVTATYTVLQAAFVFIHIKRSGHHDHKFVAWIWFAHLAFCSSLLVLGIVNWLVLDQANDDWLYKVRVWLFLVLCILPILTSAIRDWKEFRLISSPYRYVVYLIVGAVLFAQMIPSYSLARMADLTWGNRPEGSIEVGRATQDRRIIWQRRTEMKMFAVNTFVVFVTLVPLWLRENEYMYLFLYAGLSFIQIPHVVALVVSISRVVVSWFYK